MCLKNDNVFDTIKQSLTGNVNRHDRQWIQDVESATYLPRRKRKKKKSRVKTGSTIAEISSGQVVFIARDCQMQKKRVIGKRRFFEGRRRVRA